MLRPATRSERKGLLTINELRESSLEEGEWEDSVAGKHKKGAKKEWNHPCLQVAIVVFYIMAWVANGALLQGVTTGFGGDDNNDASPSSYNKPAAVTWFSYNFMMISGFVVWKVKRGHGALLLLFGNNNKRDGDLLLIMMDSNSEQSLWDYICEDWAGNLGIYQALLYCSLIAYMLMCLNVFMVLGLECISISLSNAVYQLQTPITLAFSVGCCLKQQQKRRQWVPAEVIGILVSITGILAIVLPPILKPADNNGSNNDESSPSSTFRSSQCFVSSSNNNSTSLMISPVAAGVLITIASATIGGAYLVFWGVFSEHKDVVIRPTTPGALEFLDTHTTLAAIGFCNLVVGWPTLVVLHWMGLESFQLPSTATTWGLLVLNGLVEYAFDASCAMAIYATSPITVAVVAPLTIPLSVLVDEYFYGVSMVTDTEHPWLSWLGALAILCGTTLLEVKPDLPCRQLSSRKNNNNNRDRFDRENKIEFI
mmetsp:Transcript_536/g.896  ORF Transcript_536/g.896 Transcript_536/m.896 type:complete len:482 (+) Transcript_536:138-1583(+)